MVLPVMATLTISLTILITSSLADRIFQLEALYRFLRLSAFPARLDIRFKFVFKRDYPCRNALSRRCLFVGRDYKFAL